MRRFDERVIVREKVVAGHGDWKWPQPDTGAWEGPHLEVEPQVNYMLTHVTGRRSVVQAGGCCGMYPRVLADYFRRVYTFEPDPMSFHCLVNNCQEDHVVKFNAALSDRAGLAFLDQKEVQNVGMNTVSLLGGSCVINTMRLDDLNLDDVDAIQLDCEGWEACVLAGAGDTIDRCRPVISVETNDHSVRTILETHCYKEVGRCGPDAFWVPI